MIRFFLILFFLHTWAFAQNYSPEQTRLAAAKNAFDAGHWDETVQLSQGPANQSPEFDFLRGLALSRMKAWDQSKVAFEFGARKSPRDSRFLVELAGIAYKQKDFRGAKNRLRAALLLNPRDPYALEFLGTIYLLDGNLEAALKYWNSVEKPRLSSVTFSPAPQLNEALRDRALVFNAPQVLQRDALLTTDARLANLQIFPQRRFDLAPAPTGDYDATLHLSERNGWGESKLEGAVSLLSGIPYATVYPEFYNLGHKAVNLTSLARWDSEKRRVFLALSLPLYRDPGIRLRIYSDARNENWNLTRTFFGAPAPVADLNMRRIVAGAEIHRVANGRWSWSAGAEVANRNFRNVGLSIPASKRTFFTGSNSLAGWFAVERSVTRIPEHRFTLDSAVEAKAGRGFASGLGPFGTLRGSLQAHWFPRSKGDDYEMQAHIRAGGTLGKVALDELFQLGIERDNDLWLRGHAGTMDGRKGAAPLGRRFFLANWEMDKNIYRNGFLTIKLGPFLDNGAVADSSGLFGSRRWLWDSGVQCKIRILGGVTVLFSYGRDLRAGQGAFYGTSLR